MNDATPTPPPLPVQSPLAASLSGTPNPSFGQNPGDQAPILGFAAAIEAILREPDRVWFQLRQPHSGRLIAAMLVVTVACALIYGFVIGAFAGGAQFWAAPVKVTAGLLLAALTCLPSLYVFACLGGAQARLNDVVGLVTGLLMLTTVLLIGFAPVAWVFSQSTESVAAMGVLHLVFWFVASWFGLRFLHAGFTHLNARTGGIKVWMLIFIVVVMQMTTALRPIVGKADTLLPIEKQFFLSHWLECLK